MSHKFIIERSLGVDKDYYFTLTHWIDDEPNGVLMECETNSPIAPQRMRDLQAKLNTKAMLG